MQKFSQLPYQHLSIQEINTKLQQLLDAFKNAHSLEGCLDAYQAIDTYKKEVDTNFHLGYIRHTLDTTDDFYIKENDHIDQAIPEIQPLSKAITKALLDSPYRPELESRWGKLMFVNDELELKTFTPAIVDDLKEEARLATAYNALMASAQIDFDGQTMTLAQLSPYMQKPDRNVRKAALTAMTNWFLTNTQAIDDIYDQLVALRAGMSKKLGHENFVETGYYRMQRNCYTKEMVDQFRQGVVTHLVPIANRLMEAQRQRIGVETLTAYDRSFEYPTGNPTPKGTPEEIFAHGQTMYHALSPETGAFFDFMMQHELFDVHLRKGKRVGGYCHFLPSYGAPFIFANFNGTSGDIDVLTHEAGHAYAAYLAKDIYPSKLGNYGVETAEIHSMAMEFLTWPWMEGFFKQDTTKYYHSHLGNALRFLPSGCLVDEFQHHVYARPEMTANERHQLNLDLRQKYGLTTDTTGFPFLEQGRSWQQIPHLFGMPFYYIDYCLAQIVSLFFWAESQKDHQAAWEKYHRLVSFAGTKTFVELLEDAGIPSPFVSENLKLIADEATKFLDAMGDLA